MKHLMLILCGLTCLLGTSNLFAADAELLLSDDFAVLNAAWGKSGADKSVEGGKLVVRLEPDSIHRNLYRDKKFDSADIRLKITELKGGTDQPAGLIFWAADRDNHYSALIRTDGQLYVSRRMQGKWIRPIDSRACAEIKMGIDQVNELRVVTSGDLATIYVNEREVVAFRGFPPRDSWQIGVHAESGSAPFDWAFSELRVYQAVAASPHQGPVDEASLFADDFKRVDPTWGDANERWNASGGKLMLKPRANSSMTRLYGGTLFDDADIRVKVSQVDSTKGGTNQIAGIIFWASDVENYYLLAITAEGGYFIGRQVEGKSKAPQPLITRSEVQKGIGKVNELRVVTQENTATIFVNGKQITKLEGYKHPELSMIGLKAESDEEEIYTWSFTDLVVRKPE